MADSSVSKKTKRTRRIPSKIPTNCVSVSPENSLKFIIGIDTDQWKLGDILIGIEDGQKVTHFHLDYVGNPGICPDCGCDTKIHDSRERSWRHSNLDDTICYIHAFVPRCQCPKCGKISNVSVPWADSSVTYTKRFMEIAIQHMSQMSLAATARLMVTSWSVLDGIVEKVVTEYLDKMDLSKVRRIRVDETSAKKHHRYITVVTDVDTGDIIFITKGKDKDTIRKFAFWLKKHNGLPENIELMATDFGDAFVAGASVYLPNAEPVLDPFHLVQIANRHLDRDRAACQINGERKKKLRYALLKGCQNLTERESMILMDFTKDHETVGMSYQMKESLRQIYLYEPEHVDIAKEHLSNWITWASRYGTQGFKALAKTVRTYFDGIIRAIETGINNGYQESLNGRIQLSKRLGRGYRKEQRLGRIVFFRDAYRSY